MLPPSTEHMTKMSSNSQLNRKFRSSHIIMQNTHQRLASRPHASVTVDVGDVVTVLVTVIVLVAVADDDTGCGTTAGFTAALWVPKLQSAGPLP